MKTAFEYDDLIGVPFVDGGRDTAGFDCWGLVKECFERQGIAVKDYAIGAMESAKIDKELKTNEPYWDRIDIPVFGCLVLLNISCQSFADHVGIYVGNHKFLHAYAYTGVCLSPIKRWKSHIKGYYLPREVRS